MGYEDFLANILVKQCLPVLVYDLNLWYWQYVFILTQKHLI